MSKRELLIALGFAAVLVCMITGIRMAAVDRQRGDTALFLQITENIAQRGAPVSEVFANTQAFLEGKTLSTPARQLASDPLAPPKKAERNMMDFHAYSILFLSGLLARVFPSDVVLFSEMAISFVGLALLCYIALRREKVAVVAALAFTLLVISHPAWGESLYAGQPYPDRLFLLAGFAFMYLATRPATPRVWLVVLGLLCASINERAAIAAGEFLGLYTLAFWRGHTRDRVFRLVLSALLFCFGMVIVKFVLHNGEYDGFLPSNAQQLWANVSSPIALLRLRLFALVNLPFLILAFFNWRMALPAVVLMLPNIVGDIGGAEKVGWSTSYQTYYQPALMLAALFGYRRLYELAGARKLQWAAGVPLLGTLVAYLCFLSPVQARHLQFGEQYARYHFIPTFLDDRNRYSTEAGHVIAANVGALRAAVPDHAVVTMIEAGMPILYRHDIVRVFPIDLERADYALVDYEETPKGTRYFGASTFLGQAEQENVDAMVLHRMRVDGYDFKHVQKFPILALALVKRVPNTANVHHAVSMAPPVQAQ